MSGSIESVVMGTLTQRGDANEDTPAVPLHFSDYSEAIAAAERMGLKTCDEDGRDAHTKDVDRLLLPSEVVLMEHFTAHYNAFADTVKHNINEPFTTDQLIMLHRTYSGVWGQGQVKR